MSKVNSWRDEEFTFLAPEQFSAEQRVPMAAPGPQTSAFSCTSQVPALRLPRRIWKRSYLPMELEKWAGTSEVLGKRVEVTVAGEKWPGVRMGTLSAAWVTVQFPIQPKPLT